MNIEISDNYIKIIFIRKSRKSIYIDKSIIKEISISHMHDEFNKGKNKELKSDIELYRMQLIKTIREEVKTLNKKYKYIHYNMQNNDIIIRNIKVLNVKKKKDIKAMIEFEINQYIPINLKDYEIRYRIIESNVDELNLKVTLVPLYMINLCKDISYMLNMKPKKLNINFDILQKIITENLILDFNGSGIFLEGKDKEIILNVVKNKIVEESYILTKTTDSYQSILTLSKEFKDMYYYGIGDSFTIDYFSKIEGFKILKLKDHISISNNTDDKILDNMNHINGIGMVI